MKKKVVAVLLSTAVAVAISSCGVKQEDYDSLIQEKQALETQLSGVQQELSDVQADYYGLEQKYRALESEYAQYKEDMKPFEEMEAAEAEQRKAEAEAKQKEEENQKTAAEAVNKIWNYEDATLADGATRELYQDALKKVKALTDKNRKSELMEAVNAADEALAQQEQAAAEEEARGYETGITYDQLARTPDDYIGKKVKFSGKVVQVIEGDDDVQIRLAVNKDYDQILFCAYDSSIVSSRVLEDDIITIYGISAGTISYQSTMGGKITIPSVLVEKIEQ